MVRVAETSDLLQKTKGELVTKNEHLRTDHLLASLERQAAASGLITLSSQAAQFFLNFASIIVLARLLNPADFGLVAMVRTFREAGLSRATIQREGITDDQVSNLFWLNIAISGAMGLFLTAASPLIAWFYREPRLVLVTAAVAATFPLSGLTVQHTALLMRRMRFQALALIQVGSQFFGVAIGIGMAWFGFSYWSLVGLQVATGVATVLLTYLAIPWWPRRPVRGRGTRPLVAFGSQLAAGSLVFSFAKGFDGLAIGRFLGADALGLYSRGGALLNRPMDQILGAAETVVLPMLSRIQTDPNRYRSTFLQFYEGAALTSCLLTGLLLALARPITLTVLGPNWDQAAVIFAGLTLSALCSPVAAAASWLFVSQGRGRGALFSTSLVSGVFVASVVIGIPFGPAGVAFATSVICALIGMPALFYVAGREGPVSASDLWTGFLRYVPLWALVCGVTYSMHLLFAHSRPIVQLLICAPVGLLAGTMLIYVSAPLRRTATGLINIVRQLKSAQPPMNS
jgi:O-antigen/teichoic acid export membrane protein